MQQNLTKRFFKYVKKTTTCWLWIGGKTPGGYGAFNHPNKQIPSHRFSWQIHKGAIPKGLWVLHKCDVRACVKPSHLFLGTHQDNVDDMVGKGREPWGENCYNHRLKKEQIAEIRFLYRPKLGGILGRIYGVSHKHIWKIIRRKAWKHI